MRIMYCLFCQDYMKKMHFTSQDAPSPHALPQSFKNVSENLKCGLFLSEHLRLCKDVHVTA